MNRKMNTVAQTEGDGRSHWIQIAQSILGCSSINKQERPPLILQQMWTFSFILASMKTGCFALGNNSAWITNSLIQTHFLQLGVKKEQKIVPRLWMHQINNTRQANWCFFLLPNQKLIVFTDDVFIDYFYSSDDIKVAVGCRTSSRSS